jgi:transcription elongation factor Elf1
MKYLPHDANHLIRVGLLFLGGIGAFLGFRGLVVPRSFGQYGHYRGDAIKEIANRTPTFAGREACAGCHQEIVDLKQTGKHANVGCEACHGPLARHVDDATAVVPQKLDTAVLCVRCHEANSGKPKRFPQVNSKEHAGDVACGTCHQPHRPKIEERGSK